jgi:hypothetical protein
MRHHIYAASATIILGAGLTVLAAGPARAQASPSDPCRAASGDICTEWIQAGTGSYTITWNTESASTTGAIGAECIDIPAPAPGAVAIAVDNQTSGFAQLAAGSCQLPLPLGGDEILPRTEERLPVPDTGMPVILLW